MLNILANTIHTATGMNSHLTPLGQDERHKLYLEQSRKERRLARMRADQRFYQR
jgi:hypothetical protein